MIVVKRLCVLIVRLLWCTIKPVKSCGVTIVSTMNQFLQYALNVIVKELNSLAPGTQKVEEELRRHFKGARIARLDQDVTKHKDMGEEILQDFGNHKYDILLGTQMVSKGHDFKDVTAVGILTADSVLNIPVYSASERAFDLLTQTSGRAGRGDKVGSVVIQTYNPLNYAIIKSKAHDYLGFLQ